MIMAKFVFHPADSRGEANHGWLQSRHTFSFANYFDANRMNFGALRVLNDDIVAAGMGFGQHPHNNMEIISIPLLGDLEHQDSMGNSGVIQQGDVQVMSAGTGVTHSEYNKNQDREVRFLQIWVIPNERDVEPRYDQLYFDAAGRHNAFQQIISPNPEDKSLWIHQDAWFHLADFDSGYKETYQFKGEHTGLYVFVLSGDLAVEEQLLHTRDGLAISDTREVTLQATTKTSFLLMEVPL